MGKKRRSREFKNNSQVIDMEEARRQRLEKRQAEKAREEAQRKEKSRGKMAIRRSRNRRRLMIGVIVVCIIAVVAFSIINVISLKKEQHDVLEQQQELKEEKAQLEEELSEINDPENLEEQARDQLRLIKPGEVLYMFPEEITDRNKEATQETEEE